MWGKIIIPMYRLWLNGLYGLYGPRCPLFSKRPINLISLSLSFIKSGILHTLKFHLHTLSCHFWLNLCLAVFFFSSSQCSCVFWWCGESYLNHVFDCYDGLVVGCECVLLCCSGLCCNVVCCDGLWYKYGLHGAWVVFGLTVMIHIVLIHKWNVMSAFLNCEMRLNRLTESEIRK